MTEQQWYELTDDRLVAQLRESLAQAQRELATVRAELADATSSIAHLDRELTCIKDEFVEQEAELAAMRQERETAPVGIVEACHAGELQITTTATFMQHQRVILLRVPEPRDEEVGT